MNQASHQPLFPLWVRWVSLAWLAVWIPVYALYWGWANFLHLCDVAVLLTCIGFARGDVLLLSSQAVSSLIGDLLWCLDASWTLFSNRHLTGGTEYMWDTRFPLWVRLLSLFHVVLPMLLLAALSRTGYDHRALRLQCGIEPLFWWRRASWVRAGTLTTLLPTPSSTVRSGQHLCIWP